MKILQNNFYHRHHISSPPPRRAVVICDSFLMLIKLKFSVSSAHYFRGLSIFHVPSILKVAVSCDMLRYSCLNQSVPYYLSGYTSFSLYFHVQFILCLTCSYSEAFFCFYGTINFFLQCTRIPEGHFCRTVFVCLKN